MTAPARGGRRLLAAAGLLCLPFTRLGYGTDVDAYGVLAAGRHLLETGAYVPSRNPGYPVFELAALGLDRLGGAGLINLVGVGFALWAGASFLRLAARLRVPHALPLAAVLLFHPVFLIHATSAHDQVWALALLLGGLERALAGRRRTAAVLLGLMLGVRLASLAGLAGAAAVLLAAGVRPRAVAGTAAGALALGLPWYLLPAAAAGWSPRFLTPGLVDPAYWTPWLRLGKFGYKHLVFWGPAGLAVLAWAAVRIARGRGPARVRGGRETRGLAAAFLLAEALFLAFPIETGYLLPGLPFGLLLLGRLLPDRRTALLLAAAVVLTAFVRIDVARPDAPGRARTARLGLWTGRGVLLEDVRHRLVLRRCTDLDCAREYLADLDAGRSR